jgi:hypothetical protein
LLQISATQQALKQLVEDSQNDSIVGSFSMQSQLPNVHSRPLQSQHTVALESAASAAQPLDSVMKNSVSNVPNANCS